MQKNAAFVSSPIYEAEAFGTNHPLSFTRQGSVLKLCRMMDWLKLDELVLCEKASKEVLMRFHDADYIEAFQAASDSGKTSAQNRNDYNFGNMENPIFLGVFERASMTVGGSILAAQLALDGKIVFHPAGGTHHGRPDKASGFCYFNDPVFAILTLLDAGLSKVLYLDLDAHFGDGVASAFAGETRVTCISIHEEKRWPYLGALDESDHKNLNLPVPPNLNDREFKTIFEQVIRDKIEALAPEAIVIVAGADCLYGDPLSKMNLHNTSLWDVISELCQSIPHAVVLGGGGYNPWVTVRYWAGLWAKLADKAIPETVPELAKELFRGFDSDLIDEEDRPKKWFETIADSPSNEPCRTEVSNLIQTFNERFARL